jgi:hypothetical protein
MRFDFASRRTTGGLSTLELKGTDQLKKGSSWPGSGVETMSTMPGETRVVINWSSQFIDKTRVCPARRLVILRSQGASYSRLRPVV